ADGEAVAVPSGSWREREGDQLGAPRTEGALQRLPATFHAEEQQAPPPPPSPHAFAPRGPASAPAAHSSSIRGVTFPECSRRVGGHTPWHDPCCGGRTGITHGHLFSERGGII